MSSQTTSQLLSNFAQQGWLYRVRRGLYIPVPLSMNPEDVVPEEPWVIAQEIFQPCYIGWWSATEYWSLTDQIFQSTLVVSAKKLRSRDIEIQGNRFIVKTTPLSTFPFGIKQVWKGENQVSVSDPTRTIVDILDTPWMGAGFRSVCDIFQNYLRSSDRKISLLLQFAKQIRNKTVYKRLGFLLESFAPEETVGIQICKKKKSRGYSKFDPDFSSNQLITRWNLWVPVPLLQKRSYDW